MLVTRARGLFTLFDIATHCEQRCKWSCVLYSSVLRLDQPNYYAYFYLKESICLMYMKLSRKFVISVVIDLPKNFASNFGHVARNDV